MRILAPALVLATALIASAGAEEPAPGPRLSGVEAQLWLEGQPTVAVEAEHAVLTGDERIDLGEHRLAVGDDLTIAGQEGSISPEDASAHTHGDVSAVLRSEEPLEIRAEHFRIDARQHRGTFTGSVVVTQGTLTLLCETLEVLYDAEGGQVSSVTAAGAVEIRQGDRLGRGQQATFDRASGAVVLTGEPFLRQGPVQLRGASIRFFVDGGEIACDGCQAVFDGS